MSKCTLIRGGRVNGIISNVATKEGTYVRLLEVSRITVFDLLTSLGKTFFAWYYVLNENNLL